MFTLQGQTALRVKQRFELTELILNFETRNKYEIFDSQNRLIAFAAEQQKGLLGILLRQFLGHWRSFDILIFSPDRQVVLRAHHPFRFFFQRLEIYEGPQQIGALQQRFSILRKRFDVLKRDQIVMEMASPIFSIWSFPFSKMGRKVATVAKRWSGLFSEFLTDKDNFVVEFHDPNLLEDEKKVIMASAIFIDLNYFERKG